MKNRYINDRTGKFGPDAYYQRKMHHEQICSLTDVMMHKKEKRVRQNGLREVFLQEYERNGYNSAKKMINDRLGKEVYSDIILMGWIGIDPIKTIFEAYRKENRIEDAYKVANKLNRNIGSPVIRKEDVDLWIAEESKRLIQEEKGKDEEDDAR